jgi:hypothetical protein
VRKSEISALIEESRQCVLHYCSGDFDYLYDRIAADALWIGIRDENYCSGREFVMNCIRKYPPIPCRLTEFSLYPLCQENHICVLGGTCALECKNEPDKHYVIRITIVWKQTGSFYYIEHVHDSVLGGSLPYMDKAVSVKETVSTRKTAPAKTGEAVEVQKRRNAIAVRAMDDKEYSIALRDIEFAEARDHNTRIRTASLDIEAYIEWKDFIKTIRTDEQNSPFIQVHRSYIVNCRYVRILSRNGLEMHDGSYIPVPTKRYTEVYAKLQERITSDKI